MIININTYVNTLKELKITANQFLLCYLLLTDQKVETTQGMKYVPRGNGIANLYKYASTVKNWTREEIDDLVIKGYMIDTNTYIDGKIYPDYFEVTNKFKNIVFMNVSDFDEFWNTYPAFVANFTNPNGPKIKLKIVDPTELEKEYQRRIKTKAEHKQLMEVLHWAIKNQQINMRIDNFILSGVWRDMYEEMQKYESNSNFNLAN